MNREKKEKVYEYLFEKGEIKLKASIYEKESKGSTEYSGLFIINRKVHDVLLSRKSLEEAESHLESLVAFQIFELERESKPTPKNIMAKPKMRRLEEE